MNHLFDYIDSSVSMHNDALNEFKDFFVYLTLLSHETANVWNSFHIPNDLCETNYDHSLKFKKAIESFSINFFAKEKAIDSSVLVDINYYVNVVSSLQIKEKYFPQGKLILSKDDFFLLASSIPHTDVVSNIGKTVYKDKELVSLTKDMDTLTQLTQTQQYLNNFVFLKKYYLENLPELESLIELNDCYSKPSEVFNDLKYELSSYRSYLNSQLTYPLFKKIGAGIMKHKAIDVFPYLYTTLQIETPQFLDYLTQ